MMKRVKEAILIAMVLLCVMILVAWHVLDEERHVLTYNKTLIAIQKLDAALLEYVNDVGVPPISLEGLITNTGSSPLWRGPYVQPKDLISPDGYKYCYQQFHTFDGGHYFTVGSERGMCRHSRKTKYE